MLFDDDDDDDDLILRGRSGTGGGGSSHSGGSSLGQSQSQSQSAKRRGGGGGGGGASGSMPTMTSAGGDVRRLWAEYMAVCTALRQSNTKERLESFRALQAFLGDDLRRFYVHRWHGWGFVLSKLLGAVQAEFQGYAGVPVVIIAPPSVPGGGGKRTRRAAATKALKKPHIEYWDYLHHEFTKVHGVDAPMLHLDPNGRSVLQELVGLALGILGRDVVEGEDPSTQEVYAQLERAAWKTLALILQYRVYCALLERTQLQDILELGLAAIDLGAHATQSASVAELPTRAKVVQLVLVHSPFDLHDWLPKLLPFFGDWFRRLSGNNNGGNRAFEAIAPTMLSAMMDVSRSNSPSADRYLLTHGLQVLHYIQRSWRRIPYRDRALCADFVSLYFRVVSSNLPSLPPIPELEPHRLVREARAFLSIVVNPKEVHQMFAHSRALTRPNPTTSGQPLELEAPECSFLMFAADVICAHDQLLELVADVVTVESTEDESKTSSANSPFRSPATSKRTREMVSSMAWEQLLDHLNQNIDTEQNVSTPGLQLSQRFSERRLPTSSAQSTRQSVPWLLMLLSVIRRHGQYYVRARIGDLIGVMRDLTTCLETETIDLRQIVALHVLIQLGILARNEPNLCGDLFEEHWTRTWSTLWRQDLPYCAAMSAAVLRDHVGDLVFQVLAECLALDLVPIRLISSYSHQIWRFLCGGFAAKISAAAESCATPTSARDLALSPIVFLTCLLHRYAAPQECAASSNQITSPERLQGKQAFSIPGGHVGRLQLIGAIFDHIRVGLQTSETYLSSSVITESYHHDILPFVHGQALLSLFKSNMLFNVVVQNNNRVPTVLAHLGRSDETGRGSCSSAPSVSAGFGVHFSLEEWGVCNVLKTQASDQSSQAGAFDVILSAVREQSCNPGMRQLNHDRFVRLDLPDHLLAGLHVSIDPDVIMHESSRYEQPTLSATLLAETSQALICGFDSLLDIYSSKLCSVSPDSDDMLVLLNSLMTVGLILATMVCYDGLDRSHQAGADSMQLMTPLIKKFLEILSNHFTAGAIDAARSRSSQNSTLMIVRTLSRFQTFILLMQGKGKIQSVHHPCADPIELRTPSDLRQSVRRVVAAIEASLELSYIDSSKSNEASQSGNASYHSMSIQARSSSSVHSSDWTDTSIDSSRKSSMVAKSVEDSLDDNHIPSQLSESHRASSSNKLLTLWCMRSILLLKKESGLKAVRKCVFELDLTPDYLLAVAAMVCSVPGCDSLDFVVRILGKATKRMSNVGVNALMAIFDCETLRVFQYCLLMFESRKQDYKEDIPSLVFKMAHHFMDSLVVNPLYALMMATRRTQLSVLEICFRLNPDEFGEFVDVVMKYLVDSDHHVRLMAARSLQSLFYMYPEGGAQVFRDLYQFLLQCLPQGCSLRDGQVSQNPAVSQDLGEYDRCGTTATSAAVLAALYVCACSNSFALPEVLFVFLRMAGCSQPVQFGSALLSEWLGEITRFYAYDSICHLLEDHFAYIWSQHLSLCAGSFHIPEEEQKHRVLTAPISPNELIERFPIDILLGNRHNIPRSTLGDRDGLSFFTRNMDQILPIAVLFDAATGTAEFPLVRDFISYFSQTEMGSSAARLTDETEEQLITGLFALSFILHASQEDTFREMASQMLLTAEEKATTHALSISHLGHVVIKMARFAILDIAREGMEPTDPKVWLVAMREMKNKYSGFDWSRMNLSELLASFHHLLLESAMHEPRANRAICCISLFVEEIKDAVTDNATLQQLILHVCFQAINILKRRDKPTTRKLTFLIRELCDGFMRQNPDSFGKYLNHVVQEIASILVSTREPKKPTATAFLAAQSCIDGDDRANLEWVVFAICNNLATDLGKYVMEIDIVPSGVSSCLDKLNSLVATSSKTTHHHPGLSSGDESNTTVINALRHIELFVQRSQNEGSAFTDPRPGPYRTQNHPEISRHSSAAAPTALRMLKEQVKILRSEASSTTEIGYSIRNTIAKLARTLFTMSVDSTSTKEFLIAVADVLGEIGHWDPQLFDLAPSGDGAELSQLYQRFFCRGALRDLKVPVLNQLYEGLLVYLSSLLFEPGLGEPEVLHLALQTLKTILRLEEGVSALARCTTPGLQQFLEPYAHSSPSNWSISLSKATTSSATDLTSLWRSHEQDFRQWICILTATLARKSPDPVLRAANQLARHRADLSMFIFPYVLWTIYKAPNSKETRTASAVNEGIREILTTSKDPRVLQLVLHTINFLRETEKVAFVESNGRQASSRQTTKRPNTNHTGRTAERIDENHLNQTAYSCMVDVDLLDVAAAANRAKMPYSAMQYVEMWLESGNGGTIPLLSSISGTIDPALEDRVRQILIEAYRFDDDVDGLHGVNDGRTVPSQLTTYDCERAYSRALPLYDVQLQFQNASSDVSGMLNALHRLGYHHMLAGHLHSQTVQTQQRSNSQVDEYHYELAWKSMQWNVVSPQIVQSEEIISSGQYQHHKTLHNSLQALVHNDWNKLADLVGASKVHILENTRLSLQGLEATKDEFTALLWLQCMDMIECCERHLVQSQNGAVAVSEDLSASFKQWQAQRSQTSSSFDVAECLLSLSIVIAQVVGIANRDQVLARLYLSLSELSRKAGRVAIAYRSQQHLEALYQKGSLQLYEQMEWRMERARLLWSQNETRSAIWTAKQVQRDIARRFETNPQEDITLKMLHVSSLTTTGKWLASQRSESSQVITDNYLQRATDIVDAIEFPKLANSVQDAAKAHLALAEYMADMYHQVHGRVTSREWLAGKRVAEARQRELDECLAMNQTKQLENRAHIHALNKEVQYDREERIRVESSVDQFLAGAMYSFGKGLAYSQRSELATIFRVLSLWFSNHQKPIVNSVFQDIVDTVPSYKFVPLSYQIISRVGSSNGSRPRLTTDADEKPVQFEDALSSIVLKLCEQHPHHALIQVIALKNSGDVEGKGALEFRMNVGDAKSESARKYLDQLRKGPQRELLESLDILSNAYIQLALFDTREYHKLGKKIPLSKVPISTLSGGSTSHTISFDQCLRGRSRRAGGNSTRAVMPAVLTSSITPRPDMDYSGVVRVLSFEPLFSITDSGIHRPKIIFCHGSDGRRFKQLVKGKDDTRQDLVIEQVFDSVNHFLKEDKNTRQRNLRLCTYKVVPLSPIAGVLEWVDNTTPWGAYLVGRTAKRLSAHERYHPHEWKHTDCRMYLKNAADKYKAYKEVEAHFTPVFHHFFLEKFPDASMWFKRRLSYVQSAAVTSIVGYILGIGDRHSQNILIHEETAELVHIDFGVVFDQGMALFTPETVPFRLTRDLVDGMGVAGTDGVFTRCCEATLQLLRKKSGSVVTILEVFVHDPLYRWTLSPLKALRIQEEGGMAHTSRRDGAAGSSSTTDDGSSGDGNSIGSNNDAAARALIRVKQKLEGYEDPNGNALSIEGQVKQLIAAAQDPHNLCALFPGWAPWL